MLPYKSSSHSAKCVRCAPLRSEGAADWRPGPRWSILSMLCPVHPFPLRGTSPQGETRDMREKTASHILHVPFRRFPPLVAGATTFPPQAGAEQPVLSVEPLYEKIALRSFIVPLAVGGIGIYMMAPKAPYLPSGTVLHTSRGRKPGARPGSVSRSRTEPLAPRAKGPAAPSTLTPVRACQPSGILESTAQVQVPIPIPTAPQAPEPSSPSGLVPFCVIFLLHI